MIRSWLSLFKVGVFENLEKLIEMLKNQ